MWYNRRYPGAVVVVLALLSPALARARYGVPYWIAVCACSVMLALPSSTPLRWALGLVPGFDSLHAHSPDRILVLAFLSVAVLAGAAADSLARSGAVSSRLALLPVGMPAGAVAAPALVRGGLSPPCSSSHSWRTSWWPTGRR